MTNKPSKTKKTSDKKATPAKMAIIGAGVAAVATGVYLAVTKGSKAAGKAVEDKQAQTASSSDNSNQTTAKPKAASATAKAPKAAPKASTPKAEGTTAKASAKSGSKTTPAGGGAAKNVDVALNNEVASHTTHNPNNAGDFTDDGATGNAD